MAESRPLAGLQVLRWTLSKSVEGLGSSRLMLWLSPQDWGFSPARAEG